MEMKMKFLDEDLIIPFDHHTNQSDLKILLNKMKGIPINQISIFSEGKLLHEDENIFLSNNLFATLICQGGDQIFLRSIEGKTTTYDTLPTMTVAELKNKIMSKTGLPTNQQKLFFQGKLLSDEQTMESLDIKAQAIINLVAAIK